MQNWQQNEAVSRRLALEARQCEIMFCTPISMSKMLEQGIKQVTRAPFWMVTSTDSWKRFCAGV